MRRSLRDGLPSALLALALCACAYTGADDPVSRKFSWFSYLNGDDIRQSCSAGGPDRYRVVYNGINIEQRRTYDLTVGAGRRGHSMAVRIIGASDLSDFSASDLFGPWRGAAADTWLLDGQLAEIVGAMERDGNWGGPPFGLRLPSIGFYWVVVSCRGGRFFFDAYLWPAERFRQAELPGRLLALDPTGVALNPPRDATESLVYPDRASEDSRNYTLDVGRDGLVGIRTLF